jgi:hypothetical protein
MENYLHIYLVAQIWLNLPVVVAAREQDTALNYGKKFKASNKGSYCGFQERKHKDLVFPINF